MPPIVTVRINGAALREIRRAKHLSTQTVAAKANIDRSYIAKLELGHRSPSPEFFERLVLALGVVDRRALLADPADGEAVA
jgi:transcriptional regulator with XRE-family HTH domain